METKAHGEFQNEQMNSVSQLKKRNLNDEMTKSPARFYLGSMGIGMARVLIGFPVEHPIDSIKTQWQARPHFRNEYEVKFFLSNVLDNQGNIYTQRAKRFLCWRIT